LTTSISKGYRSNTNKIKIAALKILVL